MNIKNFCIYPFIQLVVRTNRGVGPCCNINNAGNINNQSLSEIWNNNALITDIKQHMLSSDNLHSACKDCKTSEELYGQSIRTQALLDYGFRHPRYIKQILEYKKFNNLPFPNRLEIHLGNTCNLKCLTCKPADSSMFLEEDKKLKISNYNQKEFAMSEELIDSIFADIEKNNIDILDLRGGETMLIPSVKKVLNNLSINAAKKIILRIQTNATIFNNEWIEIFSKFKKIEVMLSIDGIDEYNEYIRFPSKWNVIEENVNKFKQLTNIKMYINCTVSNLSFLHLDKLISWAISNEIYCVLAPVHKPEIFKYTNLPDSEFETAKEKLRQFIGRPGLTPIAQLLNGPTNNTENWQKFCDMIDVRDNNRKNSIFDVFPNLKKYWAGNTSRVK